MLEAIFDAFMEMRRDHVSNGKMSIKNHGVTFSGIEAVSTLRSTYGTSDLEDSEGIIKHNISRVLRDLVMSGLVSIE